MKSMLICHNGDERLFSAMEELAKYFSVDVAKDESQLERLLMERDYDYILLPVAGVDESLNIKGSSLHLKEEWFSNFKEKETTLLTGLIHPKLETTCKDHGVTCLTYFTEDFAIANNYITAEGVIRYLKELSAKAIFSSTILIVGFGKLGQILCKALAPFQANIFVVARDRKDRMKIKIDGFHPLSYEELLDKLEDVDFCITTVPYPVLTEAVLSRFAEKNTIVLDISSAPHSFDLSLAHALGVQAYRLPQLPAKTAPITAGHLMARMILQTIGGGRDD